MFYTVEHTMKGKVDDILIWLENDMRVIENYDDEKIRVVFRANREGNKIVVTGSMYEINDASIPNKIQGEPDKCEGFVFEVSRINDERIMIIGHIAQDNLFIEKLFFTYLARLANAFDAEWKQEARETCENIKKELEKEQGWHWGFTEERVDKDTGRISRIFGRIPNEPNSTENNRTPQLLSFDEVDNIATKNLDSLDPETYNVNREPRGQNILYTITLRQSGNLLGCFRVEKRSDGVIDYGPIQGDSPEWNLVWESMLVRTLFRADGRMTEAMEEDFQRRQEAYRKQIQEKNSQQTKGDEEKCKRLRLSLIGVDFDIIDAEITRVLEQLDLEQGLSIQRKVVTPALIRYACPYEFQGLELQKYPEWVEIRETGNLSDEFSPEMSESTRNYYLKHHHAVITVFKELQKFETLQTTNIIADNMGGTVTYRRNEQGQTIITGGAINPGYYAELGQGASIKPGHIRLNHTTGGFQPGLYPSQAKDSIIKVASETLIGLTENIDSLETKVSKGKSKRPNAQIKERAMIWRELKSWIKLGNVAPKASECVVELKKKPAYRNKKISTKRMQKILNEGFAGIYDDILKNV